MTAIAFAFATLWFALWLIEHVGGREQRDDLRLRLMIAEHERDVARSMAHPSRRHLRSVD